MPPSWKRPAGNTLRPGSPPRTPWAWWKAPSSKNGDEAPSRQLRVSAQLGRKSRVRLLLLDFLAFCFVHPAQALLNSTPQLLARDRRAVAQGAQLGPGDLRMDAAA